MNGQSKPQILIIGGGIGGLAAALAAAQAGADVLVLEQAQQIGEIGAGIQLGANAFAALDALGVGDTARARSVFTDNLRLMDGTTAEPVVEIDVGEAYRRRFGNPYAVIHRADIHLSILESVRQHPAIRFQTATEIVSVGQDENGAWADDQNGNRYTADAIIGCDGVKSVVRRQLIGDEAKVTGHVVYRAVVDEENMPEDLRQNAPVVWAGPKCHLVHYPLRGGKQYNLVVTFHSRRQEEWGVTEGSKEEVLSYFQGVHPQPFQMLDRPTSWKRWATADRDPVERWSFGRITLLGDAAHPMTQYLAQGACQALEDAVAIGSALRRYDFDYSAAFAHYDRARIPRTARVLYSAREMGRIYHAAGVERLVRNSLWKGKTQEQLYDALEWLHGWKAENCLDET
ncbi:3-hydroxybenzoate 6-monooxygenase [Neisseria animalis]|uniref:3-hydroxybenzoate 6-hydroxylase n=1 Tax=Neisseria animalis TaxID=492 RepID=A0A5P3MSU4_NEIAN|nr:3-hydroxybenzoate 6-monooxygenase [Neisseria animalis]QEY23861.1 3-hydroxybenzoate 6-monooxygenase [Neisseria animalis]ROW32073.1 3-hydroxybenzoate 6-monooxygenase [Neisseria animalis]VEE05732.1 3-hydroxybenzoate 6-hydroxylase [Neisseria animalis]